MLLLALLLGGCGMGQAGQQKALSYAAHRFNSDVRWRRHQPASNLLIPKLRTPYLERTENVDDPVRVSMVELIRAEMKPKRHRAVLRYRYHWHRINRGIVRRTVVVEHWAEVKGTWLIQRLAHGSGPRFPWFDKLKAAPKRPRPPARPPAKRPARP